MDAQVIYEFTFGFESVSHSRQLILDGLSVCVFLLSFAGTQASGQSCQEGFKYAVSFKDG